MKWQPRYHMSTSSDSAGFTCLHEVTAQVSHVNIKWQPRYITCLHAGSDSPGITRLHWSGSAGVTCLHEVTAQVSHVYMKWQSRYHPCLHAWSDSPGATCLHEVTAHVSHVFIKWQPRHHMSTVKCQCTGVTCLHEVTAQGNPFEALKLSTIKICKLDNNRHIYKL